MSRMSRSLAVVLGAVILLLGYDIVSYAATGDSMILGKGNKTNKVTKVKRTTPGPVLDLRSKPGSPPLKVTSDAKVANLHADKVDGFDGEALQTTARTFHVRLNHVTAFFEAPLPLPNGTYLVNWSGNVSIDGTSGQALCTVMDGLGTYVASTKLELAAGFIRGMSGSGVIEVTSPGQWKFFCNSDGNFQPMTSLEFIDVTTQRVDQHSEATLVVQP